MANDFKRHPVSKLQSVFCNTGPASKHSCNYGHVFVGPADALYTIGG